MANQHNTLEKEKIEEIVDVEKRDFLKTMGGLAALGVVSAWIPTQTVKAMQAVPTERLPDFPLDLQIVKRLYENWSGESRYEDAWTVVPTSQQQIIQTVNWAAKNGYKVRAKGMSHNWSPLMLDDQDKDLKVVLIDMASHINQVSIDPNGIVTAEAGIQMQDLVKKMEEHGRGFTSYPAPGDLTLGGVLAIDGHGTSIPAKNEEKEYAQTYGSVSNLVVSLTALVFDENTGQYAPKKFYRNDPEISAFLVNLGKALILSVELQTSKNHYLRCQSITSIHYKELFSQDKNAGRTFNHFLDEAGRIEAIWFPFTNYPWVKVWSVKEKRPLTAKIVNEPFNYKFAENLPKQMLDMIKQIATGSVYITPAFGKLQLSISTLGLNGSPIAPFTTLVTAGNLSLQSYDLWGPSKNLILYVKPSTLRVTANGYAILTSRDNVQKVIADFCDAYSKLVEQYEALGRYPMNGPVEIRVTGLDDPKDSIVKDAQIPALSAIKPCPDHPEWDCAVWLDILTLPGTSYAHEFYNEMETWICNRYQGDSLVRPEWSKGWGYSRTKPWDNVDYFTTELPKVHAQGQPNHLTIAEAAKTLKKYDALDIYTSTILKKILA
ncbi:cholesterol oxidase substrate-binding domain-containing protein [Acinetobacter shaoyimingii]|uniref:FAD-binding protein n=1 Tax=Acinetobacter shaoyimingii TaxID=2715164 RepID=A0A6G8RXI9_9GAMM|nr:cholesterol oxidase substrate-binding domain-containing protein [Acinetobacter shaoyimingii]QIO06604.1 FAD-binding protein [Acinetobacter shaoyimingii]